MNNTIDLQVNNTGNFGELILNNTGTWTLGNGWLYTGKKILSMSPTDQHLGPCLLCKKPTINQENILSLNITGNTLGAVHEACLRRAYDVMLLNKI